MTAVFVHGVADTFRIWKGVQRHLKRSDSIALALPGFDSPVPPSFQATKEEYVDWLIDRLERIGEPVDLVGHDWGCILTLRVASLRPDLVRTWAGGSGPVSAAYEWHEFAHIWQTPGVGERWMRSLDIESFSRQLEAFGVPIDEARATVARIDDTMKHCILQLYRSAVNVGAEWEPRLTEMSAPSLIFWGQHDSTTPVEYADRLQKAIDAPDILKLECGHFTPIQCPQAIAAALEDHWAHGNKKMA
ncbi:alpha/beta hydrolase [Salinicola corii]|uniref:Alpha/beta hydrolase n=1 Tax=Salinicola corii TaxID=2606937 RepID=A0A640WJ67_9GAMM|nr:alpha/beta hydrolase [Salinicola corii]KAA0020644.1 alpha/beta hydrolase [Salinicola corii]